ncbi:hypothetical protein [Nonomuraea endophytica]|uniref:hypothetical protein n=1 Tax=Nonomuraea endophytica TaxID=714136 RepID=UPI0037C5837B
MGIWAGLVLAAIAAGLFYIGRVPRIVCLLVGVAGLGFAAVFASWIMSIPTGSTAVLWITRIAGIAGIFGLIVYVHDVLPKTGSPRRWQTPVLGLLVPTLLLVGVGGVFGQIYRENVVGGVGGGLDSAITTVFGDRG